MQMLKATRAWIAVLAALFAAGCETTAESQNVPGTTVISTAPPAAPGLVLAQSQPATPTNTASAAPTNTPVAEVVTTNATPVITEVVAPTIPQNLKISPATEKVVKLAQGGVDEKVMLAYVEKAEGKFDLDADEIVYLSDLGVPSAVLTAMLKHDGEDPAKAEKLTDAPRTEIAQQPLPGTVPQAPPVEITTNYIPNTTTVVEQQPPQTVVVQQQPQTVIVTPQPEAVTYFYDSLSPYGSWFVVPDYGWCWQPTVAVVDHGWRPYGPRGSWMWTTSGWYWHSEYSWGWAPFHYGRWHHAGARGWCWVPDRTWGPAWVSWRTTPDYCGWAPLPPAAHFTPGFGFSYYGSHVGVSFGFGLGADAYCFAPIGRFHERRVWDHHVPHHNAHSIYASSTVHNRYDWGRDNKIVNNGIPRERIERAINREIRPAEIRDLPARESAGRNGPRERFERNGAQAVIYRPEPPRADLASGVRPEISAPTPGRSVTGRESIRSRTQSSPTVTSPTPAPSPVTPGSTGREFTRNRASSSSGIADTAPAPSSIPNNDLSRERTLERRQSARPLPATPAPAPASIPSTPDAGNSDRARVDRRSLDRTIPNRNSSVTPLQPVPPPTPAPSATTSSPQYGRRDMGRTPTPTTPAPSITEPSREFSRRDYSGRVSPQISSPAPQISSPTPEISRSRPQISSPPPTVYSSPRSASPAPQSVSPSPRSSSPPLTYSSPPPTRSAPDRSLGSGGRFSSPAAAPAPAPAPRSAPPASSSAQPSNGGRGSGNSGSVESNVRSRFERR